MKKFRFSVANTSGAGIMLYILAGIFSTLQAASTVTQSGTSPFAVSAVTTTLNYQSMTNLVAAGFTTGNVLDDGTVVSGLACTAGDSGRRIRDVLNYIRSNGAVLKQIDISADDSSFFDEELEFSRSALLDKSETKRSILLSQYLDSFQNITTKVSIPFANGLALDAQTMMYMNFPTGRTATFTFIFA